MIGLDQKNWPTTISVTIDEADGKLLVGFSIAAPGSTESILRSRSCVGGRGSASLSVHKFLVILSFDLESP